MFRNQMVNLAPEFEDKFWIKCVENKIKKILDNDADVFITTSSNMLYFRMKTK